MYALVALIFKGSATNWRCVRPCLFNEKHQGRRFFKGKVSILKRLPYTWFDDIALSRNTFCWISTLFKCDFRVGDIFVFMGK